MRPISRRVFLVTAAAAAACSRSKSATPVARAAEYLWSQQAEDGGFHSSTYGLLRSGQSLTPFVLNALLDVPETVFPRPSRGVNRALEFIEKHINKDGALGLMNDAAADYPNYATALAIRAFRKAENREASAAPLAAMIAQLRAQQFVEQNGWSSGDPVYGGWGMGGPIHRPPATGHVDLSMTRYVLEALAAAKVGPQDPAMLHALAYLERSQGPDGGFHFSTVNLETNKAGEAEGGFLSYGTTTADGVIALRAAGLPESDPRLARAVAWLKEQHKPDRVPGFKDDSPRQTWATGLRFYYAAAISHAVPTLKVTLPEQDKDGSFRNPNNIVKEDDPLIATPFAIAALLNASTS